MSDAVAAHLLSLVREKGDGPGHLTSDQWRSLVRLAEITDVLGLVALRARALGLDVPDGARQSLDIALAKAARHHGFHLLEAERVGDALRANGIESVFVKGAALASSVYAEPGARSFRDVDLLVAPAQCRTALETLRELGYEETAPDLLEIYREHHFHVVLGGAGRPFLELHWAMTRPDDPYHVETADLMADAEPHEASRLRQPHPDTHVLVATVSLMRDGFRELKPLVDVDRLVRSGAPLRWDRIARIAGEGGLSRALRLTLELCEAHFDTPLDEARACVPPLGALNARLAEVGVRDLPFREGPDDQGMRPRLVQFWLSPSRRTTVANYLLRNRFEREQLASRGVPRRQVVTRVARRALSLVEMAGWQAARMLAGGHRSSSR